MKKMTAMNHSRCTAKPKPAKSNASRRKTATRQPMGSRKIGEGATAASGRLEQRQRVHRQRRQDVPGGGAGVERGVVGVAVTVTQPVLRGGDDAHGVIVLPGALRVGH